MYLTAILVGKRCTSNRIPQIGFTFSRNRQYLSSSLMESFRDILVLWGNVPIVNKFRRTRKIFCKSSSSQETGAGIPVIPLSIKLEACCREDCNFWHAHATENDNIWQPCYCATTCHLSPLLSLSLRLHQCKNLIFSVRQLNETHRHSPIDQGRYRRIWPQSLGPLWFSFRYLSSTSR